MILDCGTRDTNNTILSQENSYLYNLIQDIINKKY